MKTLILCILVSSIGYANQGMDAFATGMSNAMAAAIANRQAQYQAQRQAEQTQEPPARRVTTPHYDAISQYGTRGNFRFPTVKSCYQYVNSGTAFSDCVYVEE